MAGWMISFCIEAQGETRLNGAVLGRRQNQPPVSGWRDTSLHPQRTQSWKVPPPRLKASQPLHATPCLAELLKSLRLRPQTITDSAFRQRRFKLGSACYWLDTANAVLQRPITSLCSTFQIHQQPPTSPVNDLQTPQNIRRSRF